MSKDIEGIIFKYSRWVKFESIEQYHKVTPSKTLLKIFLC